MNIFPTEVELFHSKDPHSLLCRVQSNLLQSVYGFSTIPDIINNLWKRYGRVDLISSDLVFDYRTYVHIPIDELDIDNMSTAAQMNLLNQIESKLPWIGKNSSLLGLYNELSNRLMRINNTIAVLDIGR